MRAKSFLEEVDKVTKLYLQDQEGSQLQALNLVTLLEQRYEKVVINVTNAIYEGIAKNRNPECGNNNCGDSSGK